jgi:predicted RNA binding protein YcfA (HicA-like mRNA interferase family)
MKLPRDVTGNDLAKALGKLGYHITRQTGSHIRLSTVENGEHNITVPAHNPLKIGTLAAILSDIESHHKLTREDLLKRLFS